MTEADGDAVVGVATAVGDAAAETRGLAADVQWSEMWRSTAMQWSVMSRLTWAMAAG